MNRLYRIYRIRVELLLTTARAPPEYYFIPQRGKSCAGIADEGNSLNLSASAVYLYIHSPAKYGPIHGVREPAISYPHISICFIIIVSRVGGGFSASGGKGFEEKFPAMKLSADEKNRGKENQFSIMHKLIVGALCA